MYVTEKGEDNGKLFESRRMRTCKMISEKHTICSYSKDLLLPKEIRHPKENLQA